MVGLERQRRLVEERSRAVLRERESLVGARAAFTAGMRRTLARPSVLLGLFAVGFAFGAIRRGPAAREGGRGAREGGRAAADGGEARTGRLAAAAAALFTAARLFEHARRIIVLIGGTDSAPAAPNAASSNAGSASFAHDPAGPVQQDEADRRHDQS